MCNETVSGSGGMSRFVPDCYKNQKTCNKTVDNFPIAIRLKTMRNKAVDAYSSAIQYVSDQYKTQGMYNKALDTYK